MNLDALNADWHIEDPDAFVQDCVVFESPNQMVITHGEDCLRIGAAHREIIAALLAGITHAHQTSIAGATGVSQPEPPEQLRSSRPRTRRTLDLAEGARMWSRQGDQLDILPGTPFRQLWDQVLSSPISAENGMRYRNEMHNTLRRDGFVSLYLFGRWVDAMREAMTPPTPRRQGHINALCSIVYHNIAREYVPAQPFPDVGIDPAWEHLTARYPDEHAPPPTVFEDDDEVQSVNPNSGTTATVVLQYEDLVSPRTATARFTNDPQRTA